MKTLRRAFTEWQLRRTEALLRREMGHAQYAVKARCVEAQAALPYILERVAHLQARREKLQNRLACL